MLLKELPYYDGCGSLTKTNSHSCLESFRDENVIVFVLAFLFQPIRARRFGWNARRWKGREKWIVSCMYWAQKKRSWKDKWKHSGVLAQQRRAGWKSGYAWRSDLGFGWRQIRWINLSISDSLRFICRHMSLFTSRKLKKKRPQVLSEVLHQRPCFTVVGLCCWKHQLSHDCQQTVCCRCDIS